MKTILISVAMVIGLGAQAQAEELIHSVEIEKIDQVEFMNLSPMGWESDCTLLDQNGGFGTNMDFVDINKVVNIGKKVWQIVKENEPILEARNAKANALPRGVKCWDEMTGWSPTRSETYKITYKNMYGMKVVELEFRVMYTYGGQYKGQGRYLTNSTIQYSNINVLWGYIFNADVEIPQVINMGTKVKPLAGMEMTINWSVKTRPISLKKSLSSTTFFIAGDGRATTVLD